MTFLLDLQNKGLIKIVDYLDLPKIWKEKFNEQGNVVVITKYRIKAHHRATKTGFLDNSPALEMENRRGQDGRKYYFKKLKILLCISCGVLFPLIHKQFLKCLRCCLYDFTRALRYGKLKPKSSTFMCFVF